MRTEFQTDSSKPLISFMAASATPTVGACRIFFMASVSPNVSAILYLKGAMSESH